jgi:hypothetical protein
VAGPFFRRIPAAVGLNESISLCRVEPLHCTSRQVASPLDLILIDRLARSISDLQDIVRAVKAKGATLRATEQPIDTSTAAGKCFLDMLGVFAEFETNLRKERQSEGIAKAKAAGVYKGRPASID